MGLYVITFKSLCKIISAVAGWLFFVFAGRGFSSVGKSRLDGSEWTVLHNETLASFTGLTLTDSHTVFITDAKRRLFCVIIGEIEHPVTIILHCRFRVLSKQKL